MGQFFGLSILNVGRRPKCFNKLIIQSIFKIPCDEELPEIEDSELEEKLHNINQINLDALYEEGICPTGNVNKNKRLLTISFIVLKNYETIDQFKSGLENAVRTLTLKYNSDNEMFFNACLLSAHFGAFFT